MKNFNTAIIIAILIGFSFAFTQKKTFRPPGTVQIVDNFFFDETEIRNIDWKEYVSYQKKNFGIDSEQYQTALPDTLVWTNNDSTYNEPFIKTYYQHPAYNDYPVVGVSYEQATTYCTWRTQAVQEMLQANDIEGPKAFHYRLPSKTEWELIASTGFSEKTKKKLDSKRYKGRHLYNFKYKSREERKQFGKLGDFAHMPAPVEAYFPNKYEVHNLFGNIAEMVAEKGIAKGGSWAHYYEDIFPTNKDISYEKPTRWLGFRCVCEVEQR